MLDKKKYYIYNLFNKLNERGVKMKNRLKEIREKSGVSQEELAEKSGISKVSISLILNGKTNPSVDMLCKIANALGVGVSELFSDFKTSKFVCPCCGAELELKAK